MQHKNSIFFLLSFYPNNVIVSCCFSKQNNSKNQFCPKSTAKSSNSKSTLEPSSPKKTNFKTNRLKKAHIGRVKKDYILQLQLVKQPIVWKLLSSSSNIYHFFVKTLHNFSRTITTKKHHAKNNAAYRHVLSPQKSRGSSSELLPNLGEI